MSNHLIIPTPPIIQDSRVLALFSTVKHKLGPNFSQFTLDSKLGFLSVRIRLNFHVFPNSQEDFGTFEGSSGWISEFFPNQESNMENCFFKHKSRLHFQITPNSPKSWEG